MVTRPPQRDEVWLVSLDPTQGVEIQKTRPCLIVSPDEMNQHLRTVIIAPMTGRAGLSYESADSLSGETRPSSSGPTPRGRSATLTAQAGKGGAERRPSRFCYPY